MGRTLEQPIPVIAHHVGDTTIIHMFGSIRKAAFATRVDPKIIKACCRGDRIEAKGWTFYYENTIGAAVLIVEATTLIGRSGTKHKVGEKWVGFCS